VKLLSMRGRRVEFSIGKLLESDPPGYRDLHVVFAFYLGNAHVERSTQLSRPFVKDNSSKRGWIEALLLLSTLSCDEMVGSLWIVRPGTEPRPGSSLRR
jgi:hypothetical protein